MPRKKKEKSIIIKKADVFDDKRLVRTYSEEIHGEDFKLLAEMFAQKNNFQVVYGE